MSAHIDDNDTYSTGSHVPTELGASRSRNLGTLARLLHGALLGLQVGRLALGASLGVCLVVACPPDTWVSARQMGVSMTVGRLSDCWAYA